jgi:hypothetical protein
MFDFGCFGASSKLQQYGAVSLPTLPNGKLLVMQVRRLWGTEVSTPQG